MIIKYDKNKNPYVYSKVGIVQNAAWRKKTAEEFRKRHGAWWLFVGVPVRKKKSWIERYRKKDEK
mgnify:FL=1|tara:strand:+ start:2476 stop:2670 length:195 start_codon:yes stop_codon:yes gene_type:complete